MASTTRPLAGIKVLDLSRILAGPVCCQVLADLGADVVKVERPGTGDDTRQWGPPFLPPAAGEGEHGPSAYFLSANRGKRSLAVDLAHPHAAELLDDLVKAADVLVENFLPRSLGRLGLDPDRLLRLNPRLVVVCVSGYGRTSSQADVPGYDLVVQAAAGLMSITGEPEGEPMKVGVAITDVITGLYAAISALAGLHRVAAEGAGMALDLALTDCTLASLVNVAQGALLTGQRPRRYGNAHPHIVPYEAFATSDGFLVLAVGNDRQWQRFCQAAGRTDLSADERFATNPQRVAHRDELIPKLLAVMRGRSTAAWLAALGDADVSCAPVAPLDEVLVSRQAAERGMVTEVRDAAGRRYRLLNSPIHSTGKPLPDATPPPALGQHSGEVLRQWLGYDEQRIERLRAAGAIAGNE